LGGGEWCGVHDKEKLAFFERIARFIFVYFHMFG
jgi:hypothetical protein